MRPSYVRSTSYTPSPKRNPRSCNAMRACASGPILPLTYATSATHSPPRAGADYQEAEPPATGVDAAPGAAAGHSNRKAAYDAARRRSGPMRFESLSARRCLCILAALVIGAGCSSTSKKGAAVGGATGAVIGAVIGNQGDRTGTGAVVGGAIGAAAGAIIGD